MSCDVILLTALYTHQYSAVRGECCQVIKESVDWSSHCDWVQSLTLRQSIECCRWVVQVRILHRLLRWLLWITDRWDLIHLSLYWSCCLWLSWEWVLIFSLRHHLSVVHNSQWVNLKCRYISLNQVSEKLQFLCSDHFLLHFTVFDFGLSELLCYSIHL